MRFAPTRVTNMDHTNLKVSRTSMKVAPIVGGPTIASGSQILQAIRTAPGENKTCENTCTRRVGTDITLAKSSSGRHVAEGVLAKLRGLV